MSGLWSRWAAVVAVLAVSGCATGPQQHADKRVEGTVVGVFKESYSGILVSRKIDRRPGEWPLWVEVAAAESRTRNELIQARISDPDVEVGDRVVVSQPPGGPSAPTLWDLAALPGAISVHARHAVAVVPEQRAVRTSDRRIRVAVEP